MIHLNILPIFATGSPSQSFSLHPEAFDEKSRHIKAPKIAWPASWYATSFFFCSDITASFQMGGEIFGEIDANHCRSVAKALEFGQGQVVLQGTSCNHSWTQTVSFEVEAELAILRRKLVFPEKG